jgi:uncharacterized protein YdeI (YjbR/CyaY-like superfamily)
MAGRPVQEMPLDIRDALEVNGLIELYQARPFYQRNDYLSWIGRARKPETRLRRLDQMLAELEEGGVYMGMEHPPSRRG